MKPTLIALCALFLGALSATGEEGTGRTRVLLITGGHGFEEEAFFKVFKDNSGIALTTDAHGKPDATAYERGDLLTYEVVVLYDMAGQITEPQKAKFLSLFDKGIGLVVLHHALVSYLAWPDYARIIGGHYPKPPAGEPQVTEAVGYQHNVEIPVVIVPRDHPITAGMKDFTIHDEIYWGFRVGKDVTPLLTTTHPKSGNPLAWTRMEGKSRVVYLQLGHDHQAYDNPNYRELVARSIQWAARR